jgi:hypothetical protein
LRAFTLAGLILVAVIALVVANRSDGNHLRGPLRAQADELQVVTPTIVYFVGSPGSGVLAPITMAQRITYTQLVTVTTWQDVEAHDQSDPIDALLVDSGSYGAADWTWIRPRVKSGMVLATVNVSAASVVSDVQDARLDEFFEWWDDAYGARPDPWPEDFFALIVAHVVGSPASLTEQASDPLYMPPVEADGEWISNQEAVYEDAADDDIVAPDGVFFLAGDDKFYEILQLELYQVQYSTDLVETQGS